ncbi:vacuolar protein sorting-associated protein 29-like protein [Linderina pennispora]|uniref:Vacuolar protein sorting-associated protein 29 n=1 Tax=Linderina pennispora TaxID=61395 RepID=A0A1Y1VYB3_9FUNG|nr:vacuolar protein sorting-associated protein 29-like protein [Linderina pennispora]KAJ1953584.1 Vacuolar protein sorting-associated protein 29 [Linderina pennispora]ORX66260.1 vacuolar protein sorting-associated protein 29-like protein [Linderina pennispora]
MVLVLVLGDIHIPQRAADIPTKFRKLLVPGKIQQIICTGNVCDRATYEYLRSVSSDLHIVRGEFDEESYNFPNTEVIEHEDIRVGVIHGHQLVPANGDVDTLAAVARQMDVDVLLSGNTHRFEAYEEQGKFFINPGSITGAFSPQEPSPIPSFVLMDIKRGQVVTYVYQLVNDDVSVDRIEYTKYEE